ncbi:hypothetical protein PC128_g1882 [Phytophthora cactorum]|nr:hypothetical protein PC128_g1882 [Phytophthora cactorum]
MGGTSSERILGVASLRGRRDWTPRVKCLVLKSERKPGERSCSTRRQSTVDGIEHAE